MKYLIILCLCLASCRVQTPAEKARKLYIKTVSPYEPVTSEPKRQ